MAPIPTPKASVSNTNGLEKSGRANIGACESFCFNCINVVVAWVD